MFMRLVVALSLLMGIALPSEADACSCKPRLLVFPRDGAVEVPTNVRILFGPTWEGESFALEGPEGEIAGELEVVETFGRRQWARFVPEQALEPGATYRFRYGASYPEIDSAFTVGSARDDTPPPPPDFVELIETHSRGPYEDSCGEEHYAVVLLDGGDAVTLIDVQGFSTFDGSRGRVSDVVDTEDEWVMIGSSACHTNHDAGAGESLKVRFASLDLAGNFSGWSPPVELGIPEEDSCGGCSGGSGAGLLGVLALALLRRRARRV